MPKLRKYGAFHFTCMTSENNTYVQSQLYAIKYDVCMAATYDKVLLCIHYDRCGVNVRRFEIKWLRQIWKCQNFTLCGCGWPVRKFHNPTLPWLPSHSSVYCKCSFNFY